MLAFEPLQETAAADLARECLYRFLSAVVNGPYDEGWSRAQDADGQDLASCATDLLRGEAQAEPDPASLAPGELGPEDLDLTRLVTCLQQHAEALRAEYDRTFGLVIPKECPPYETEYYPAKETFARSQQMADAAGFYRAFGVEPSADRPERPDHLALELEFMAFLLMKKRLAVASAQTNAEAAEQIEVCERAERDFFGDHLAWWVPAFATGLARKADRGYLRALARALAALIAAERHRLGVPTPHRPTQPSLIEQPDEQSGCASCPLHA
jgi:TorA maturation chaperone TorD